MTDRPILFSAPMVRALIEGRKTQTRRVIKLAGRRPEYIGPKGCADDPSCWGWEMDGEYWLVQRGDGDDHARQWSDWRGAFAPGDRLWVREAWADVRSDPHCDLHGRLDVAYRASDDEEFTIPPRWKSPIHMPRWASRLTLAVTEVRVQRLCEISEADARAEGVTPIGAEDGPDTDERSAAWAFHNLWNSIHGPGAWDANPWIVALTFTVHHQNIHAKEAH